MTDDPTPSPEQEPPTGDDLLAGDDLPAGDTDPGFASVRNFLLFGMSLPERTPFKIITKAVSRTAMINSSH